MVSEYDFGYFHYKKVKRLNLFFISHEFTPTLQFVSIVIPIYALEKIIIFFMFGEGFFRKTPEILKSQVVDAQETLGPEEEYTLLPPSEKPEDIFTLSEAELKQKYARRFDMFKKLTYDKRMVERGREDYYLTEPDIDDMKKWLAALNSLDTYIQKHHEGETTLRGKQIDVFESLRNFLEQGGKEGYVKLPTGVGKTVLFTEFIEALDVKTLVVVPTKILVEQTEKSIHKFAKDLDVGKVYSYAKEHGRQVTIITYESLVSQVENKQINPKDFDCLILDETHESLSKRRMDTINKFEGAIKVGFTATPYFSDEKHVGQLLEKEIHSMSIREAVEKGMLSSVSAVIVRTEADLSSVTVNDNGNYQKDELADAVNIASRNKAAVDLYKTTFAGEHAVAYCVGIDHSHVVAEEFVKAGVPAAAISGKTPRKEQNEILEKFKSGEIKVVCNADLLIAGFDEPKASVCLNLRPTRSRVDAEQRGGRVLRIDEHRPDKYAYVVDFLDKGINPAKPPVLFADVAGGAQFFSGKSSESDTRKKTEEDDKEKVNIVIEGIDVVFDAEEVMAMVRKLNEEEKILKREFVTGRTPESALQELEQAFTEWQLLPYDKRPFFNIEWLKQNGHDGLCQWSRKNTSLEDLIAMSSNKELADSFVRREALTQESARQALEDAFMLWQALPEKKKGKFNSKWLEKNGFTSLCNWSRKNIAIEDLVAMSGNSELQKQFTKREGWTNEAALAALEEAFKKWQAEPEQTRGGFTTFWISNNGYSGLYGWSKRNVPLEDLAQLSSNEELKKNLKTRQFLDEKKVIAGIEQAYSKWKTLPIETRGKFTQGWLTDNGYENLYQWSRKNTSINDLVSKSDNAEMRKDFVKYTQWTEELAVKALEEEFIRWQQIPGKKKNFNTKWLNDHELGSLYNWAKRNGIPLEEIASKSGNEELKKIFTS